MAFMSASKAGMRARITLLDLTYLCHADTSVGNNKGPKVKVLWGREPCTHRVSFQVSGVGKQGVGSHSPCHSHPPTCHHKTISAVPISKLPQSTKDISGEISPFFIQPLLQNSVFFQVKAREKPVVPHFKTERPCHQLKPRDHTQTSKDLTKIL